MFKKLGITFVLVFSIVVMSVGVQAPTPRIAEAAPLFSTVTSSPGVAIPDNNPAGVNDTLTFGFTEIIGDVNIELHINHTWVGDLRVIVTHVNSGTSVTIIDRPGVPASGAGCSGDNINAIIDDEAANPAETSCLSPGGLNAGPYSPNNPLSAFDGLNANGDWTINVSDHAGADIGTLVSWSVIVSATLQGIAACNGDDLWFDITSGDFPFDITGTGPGLPALGVVVTTTVLTGPGTWTNVEITETTGDFEVVSLGDFTCPGGGGGGGGGNGVPAVNFPNRGEILISVSAPVVPYAAPGEYAQAFTLPADYDRNGFDTYVITATATVGGATWYAIWVGGVDYLWVPASQVQTLR